ncbi:MAG: GDP-L-fucose synthase, partial [Bacteroidia bacterium]|nr:GDP-L-fucose synthase [Bacteroidia bacterium]
ADACIHIFETIDFHDLVSVLKQKDPDCDLRNVHINIGSGTDLTICELSEMVKEITGFNGEVLWDTDKPDGTFRKLLDTSKLKELNWKSKIDLKSGIELNYNLYVEQL